MVGFDDQDRKLLLTLRKLLDELEKDSSISALEVMWQIRTHTSNQAEIPQAIFRVGDRLASVIYLEHDNDVVQFYTRTDSGGCWEVQVNGNEYQFDTFEEACGAIEHCRKQKSLDRFLTKLNPEST